MKEVKNLRVLIFSQNPDSLVKLYQEVLGFELYVLTFLDPEGNCLQLIRGK